MKNNVVIVVPSLESTSPVRGSFALANILIKHKKVFIVSLRDDKLNSDVYINEKIVILKPCKSKNKLSIFNFLDFKKSIKHLIKFHEIGIIFSSCLIPDIYNCFSNFGIKRVVSIRANNIESYKYSFGFYGLFIAIFHYFLLNKIDKVIVMHEQMSEQVKKFVFNKKKIHIIPNFIDNYSFDIKKSHPKTNPFRIIFIGWLNKRKDPLSILDPINILLKEGYEILLDYYGEGELYKDLNDKICKLGLTKNVFVNGYEKNIFEKILSSHLLIIPSWSEGTPRAAIECLSLGVPCILREIYGNSDLISDKNSCRTFVTNNDLIENIKFYMTNFKYDKRSNLLPNKYLNKNIEKRYIDLIKNIYE